MKRAGLNSPLRVLAATSVALFSLLAVFTSTAAWFDSVRNFDNDINQIEVEPFNGLLKRLTIHKLVNEAALTPSTATLEFNSSCIAEYNVDWKEGTVDYENHSESPVGLDTYTLFAKEHPVLFLFELNEAAVVSNIDITMTVPERIQGQLNHFLVETNNDGSPVRPLTQNHNPLSSVVQYRTITFASTPNYSIPRTSLSAADSFVKMNADGTPNLAQTRNSKTVAFDESVLSNSVSYVGIVFDYYSEAIEYIYTLNLGNRVFSNFEENIGFDFDWGIRF